MAKLKPCPFCGASVYIEAEWAIVNNQRKKIGYYIECDCGARTGLFGLQNNAYKAWNRRAYTDEMRRAAKIIAKSDWKKENE